jgi:hypothetical protein
MGKLPQRNSSGVLVKEDFGSSPIKGVFIPGAGGGGPEFQPETSPADRGEPGYLILPSNPTNPISGKIITTTVKTNGSFIPDRITDMNLIFSSTTKESTSVGYIVSLQPNSQPSAVILQQKGGSESTTTTTTTTNVVIEFRPDPQTQPGTGETDENDIFLQNY